MRFKLNFFIFFGLTLGNVEFFPSKGTVFMNEKDERVAFLEEKTEIQISFSVPLPHLERPDRSFVKCPGLAKRGSELHFSWSELYFLSRLRRDLGIEENAEKSIFFIKTRTRVERESSPAQSDLEEVTHQDAADERVSNTSTIYKTSSFVTTTDTPINQTTNIPEKIDASITGVSDLTAKHPKVDIRNLYIQNKDFQFLCTPSSNGKVYRLVSWASEKPIENVSLDIEGPFYNPENLKNSFYFNLNSKSVADDGNSVLKMCEYQEPKNATVSFVCKNSYALHTKYSYNMNIVFENEHACENSIFSNLAFTFAQTQIRRKRQVGEFAIPLIMGFLGYELGHKDDSEDAKIEKMLKNFNLLIFRITRS